MVSEMNINWGVRESEVALPFLVHIHLPFDVGLSFLFFFLAKIVMFVCSHSDE
jgi:hypothetical protein